MLTSIIFENNFYCCFTNICYRMQQLILFSFFVATFSIFWKFFFRFWLRSCYAPLVWRKYISLSDRRRAWQPRPAFRIFSHLSCLTGKLPATIPYTYPMQPPPATTFCFIRLDFLNEKFVRDREEASDYLTI